MQRYKSSAIETSVFLFYRQQIFLYYIDIEITLLNHYDTTKLLTLEEGITYSSFS